MKGEKAMLQDDKKLCMLIGIWRDYKKLTPDNQKIFRENAPESIMNVFEIMDNMLM